MADSALARIAGVLISPGRAFQRLRERPTWVVAFVLIVVVTGVAGQITQAKVDPEEMIRDVMGGAGSTVDESRIEAMIARQESQSPALAAAAAFAFLAALPVLCATYFWMGTRLFGGEPSFKQSFSTSVHALVPWWALKALLSLPVLLSRGELSPQEVSSGVLPSNPVALLGPEAPILLRAAAGSLDLFTLWGLFLLVIGFSIVAGIPKAASAALALLVWLMVFAVTLLPMLAPMLFAAS